MTGIVLSASVRQNLLSLQSTASLLATTQNALSTGNKVNSALDNPTEFFTAQGLNNRSSDISNLLDGIGNGVQVLQAANTGITSLQGLVASAQSIANQVLQAPAGYTTKSNIVSTQLTGANANNLLATTAAPTAGTVTAGTFSAIDVSDTGGGVATTAADITGTGFADLDLSGSNSATFSLNVDGTTKSITLDTASVAAFAAAGTLSSDNTDLTATDVANIINFQVNGNTTSTGPASVVGGELDIASAASAGTGSVVAITGYTGSLGAGALGLPTTDTTHTGTAGATTAPDITGTGFADLDLSGSNSATFSLNVDGTTKSITLDTASVAAFAAVGTLSSDNTDLTATDVANIINFQVNGNTTSTGPASVVGGELDIASAASAGTGSVVAITGYTGSLGAGALGLPTTDTTHTGTAGPAAASETFNLTLDGGATPTAITISKAAVDTYNSANSTLPQLDASNLSAADVATLINSQVGSSVASVVGGALTFTSTTAGPNSSVALGAVTIDGVATGSTGVVATAATATGATGAAASGGLSGQVLNIAATGPGGVATTITFGSTGTDVSTLNELNTQLAANNLQASIDATGKLTIETTNNAASSTIGLVTGSAATGTGAFTAAAAAIKAPVADPNSQATRASLVAQYNNVLDQINTTAQDSSFNGINLLNGDTLNLTFDETGASKLGISGVTFNDAGLGLAKLAVGTDFLDNSSANSQLTALTAASTTLRTEATSLGSNLSIVQIRQDFNKNLIDVLQTGASNLTLADTNEEAANSQALSTRQSIAVSALSLANQSQQSVLQLLR